MMEPTNATDFLVNATSASVVQEAREPLASNIFRLIVYVIIFMVTIAGNVSVLAVVYKTRELHSGRWNIYSIYPQCVVNNQLDGHTYYGLVMNCENVIASRYEPL